MRIQYLAHLSWNNPFFKCPLTACSCSRMLVHGFFIPNYFHRYITVIISGIDGLEILRDAFKLGIKGNDYDSGFTINHNYGTLLSRKNVITVALNRIMSQIDCRRKKSVKKTVKILLKRVLFIDNIFDALNWKSVWPTNHRQGPVRMLESPIFV